VTAGHWGDWSGWHYCPNGQYLCGVHVTYDMNGSVVDYAYDDTGINGFVMYCCGDIHEDLN